MELKTAQRNVPVGAPARGHASLSVLVLTFNEERNLPDCLVSLKGLDCNLFVVDSGSTDRTELIASSYGATVLHHPFRSHMEQWEWAINQLPVDATWILALDADQRVTPDLRDEIGQLISKGFDEPEGVDGFYIKRRQIFRGRWIKHGGYYPKYLLKLFRRDKLVFDRFDLVDHHFYVKGTTRKLHCDLIEQNRKEDDMSFWIDKHNRYAALLAEEAVLRQSRFSQLPVAASFWGDPDQRTLWMKLLWSRLPLYLRPILFFFYRYFLRMGFLDGKEGFVFHFMQTFWFRLLVDIKVEEGRRS